MKEVSIYIVTGIKGRWQQDGYIGYALEYYKENCKYPAVIREVVPVQQMNENRSTLEALIQALHRMRENCILTVYTESKYLYSGYEEAEYENAGNRTTGRGRMVTKSRTGINGRNWTGSCREILSEYY